VLLGIKSFNLSETRDLNDYEVIGNEYKVNALKSFVRPKMLTTILEQFRPGLTTLDLLII
jgi:hypothetical protein